MAPFGLCAFLSLASSAHRSGHVGPLHYDQTGTTERTQAHQKFTPTWERHVADEIRASVESAKSDGPFMVAAVGIPGSGKTTSAAMLGELLEEHSISTMVMPFDGYHYPLDILKTFPDPADVIYRRGAPDTFDAKALHRDLERIKNGQEGVIQVPGFDHAHGDPKPDVHTFDRGRHRVVICEGLYLLHDQDGWEEIAPLFHHSIYVNADVDLCVERLKIRNKCIPGYTEEEIETRCEQVDRTNAMTVERSKPRAKAIVSSSANPRADKDDECQL